MASNIPSARRLLVALLPQIKPDNIREIIEKDILPMMIREGGPRKTEKADDNN